MVKNPPGNAGDAGDMGSVPGLVLKMSSSTLPCPSQVFTHQSSLAKQQLHGSLAGTPPRGWAHLV